VKKPLEKRGFLFSVAFICPHSFRPFYRI
jgi:hypothetical protein